MVDVETGEELQATCRAFVQAQERIAEAAPEALRILAAIALIEAGGNSEPDVMAEALDGVISAAQTFWRLNPRLNIKDWMKP